MKHSDTITKVATAIAGAQAELQNVTADASNPHFRSKYASLPALLDTVRPVLAKHGLALVQLPIGADGRVGIETILMHASGEWIGAELTVRPVKDDPQGAGSALTYCRRYSLAAALAIGQEDDDGNAASGRNGNQGRAARHSTDDWVAQKSTHRPERAATDTTPPARSDTISESQAKRLHAIVHSEIDAAGWNVNEGRAAVKRLLSERGYESSKDIKRAEYDRVIEDIRAIFNMEPN